MKKISIIPALTVGLVLLLTACSGGSTAISTPIPATPTNAIIAEGHTLPNQSITLAFLASGRVQELLVKKGDHVSQGQVLARLGDREPAQAALAGAQAQVLAARQAYDLLTRTASLSQASAWQKSMDAQKALAAAQLAWDRLDQQAIQTDIDNAQADVSSRQKDLETAQADLSKYTNLPGTNATRKSYEDKLRTAQTNYDTAVQKLVELTNRRDTLHASLNYALAAEAEAKRTYENTRNGPDPDQLALAQAQLEVANAQVAAAQSALDGYDLKAPFTGSVADINISLHQMVSPQTWAMAVVDTSQWYVDTSDLTEMDVVKVSVGQEVKVAADALPGVPMTGVVESISSAPKVTGGDVLYTVRIRLNDPAAGLLWGMTVEVTFTP
jgi:multidrug resistance efflux pump